MKIVSGLCFILSAILTGLLFAQAPQKYQMTELQTQTLQNMQKDVQLKVVARDRAQQDLANAVAALNEKAGEIKKENKWPDKVGFDMARVMFCENLGKDGLCPAVEPAQPPPAADPKKP